MTSFKRLNRLPSFEDGFGSLLALEDSELSVIHAAAKQSADDPSAEDSVSDDLGPAYSVLAVLRQIAAEYNTEELLADIRAVYRAPEFAEPIARLAPLLTTTPAEREVHAIREAESSTLPVFLDGKIALDYRVIEQGETIKLAPVFVMRLVFDESIGGSDAIAFQADARSIESMKHRLDEVLALISKSARVIGKDAFYEHTITEHRLG